MVYLLYIYPSQLLFLFFFFVFGKTENQGEAYLNYFCPCLWNSLPEDLRSAQKVDINKSYLFTLAFD